MGVYIMQIWPESKYTSKISRDEIVMLDEIFKYYDFHVTSADKVRSAYKICTDEGEFCLKRVSHGYRKAKKSYHIMKYLKEKGFDNVADYYYTKEGKALINYKGAAFYLTHWIDGREANFSDTSEILKCSELLALFHNYAKGFKAPKHIKIRSQSRKLKKTLIKYRDQIGEFKENIDNLKLKAEFDYAYRNCIDYFYKQSELAIRILEHSGYEELCDFYANESDICHDSFYYQNILIDKNGKFYIVDLESCQYDISMSDLGKYIRRVLSKKKFRWDLDLCRRIIESYCRVRPMLKEEYTILLAILIFPHKFWKLGRKRYIKNKKWEEKRYRKKLNRLLKQKEYMREFIYCYINFYGLDIDYDPDIIEL
jgi:CotS family spore coat protein